jgi:hypothetical protein
MGDTNLSVYPILGLVLTVLSLCSAPFVYIALQQWINRKLNRDSKPPSAWGWIIGSLLGTYLWPKATMGLPEMFLETFWYELGWSIMVWLGGMVGLSLAELFDFWQERKGKIRHNVSSGSRDKSKH